MDTASVAKLLQVLLGSDESTVGREGATLARCGVTVEDIDWLWEAVCEELAERGLVPELEHGALDLSMTVEEVAAVMAAALAGEDDDA